MAERSFKSWQGEDLLPEYDFTEPSSNVHVIWPEIEVGGRAWRGESDVGTVQLRDERGETGQAAGLPADLTSTSISAHNRWAWTENSGADVMARGWIGPKDYRRDREGGLKPDRHREIAMSVLDANAQLQGIIVDANRGAETDVARVQWLHATYLQGSPRATTNLTDTYLVTGSNTVALPAQHVIGDPRTILEEIASFANKQFFVTSDEELFYDGADSVAYYSTLAITDRLVCDAPSPPTQTSTELLTWDFEQGNAYDSTGTYDSNLNYVPSSVDCPNATSCAYNDASSHLSDAYPVTAGGIYQFATEVEWIFNPSGRDIKIVWQDASLATLGSETVVVGWGHATHVGYSETAQVTAPAGAAFARWDPGPFAGVFVDNVTWSSVDTLPVTCFPPIWDVGPAASEDGQQLLSGLRLYYGAGQSSYVYVSDPVTRSEYTHYEESLTAPENITTAAAATTLANTILARRKTEDRNINVSIGPLTIDEAVQVKYGQLIPIKARAIAFADDNFFTGRIRQLRWTTPVPGMFFAHMQIERPIKDVPYGVGNRSGSEAVQAHMDSGSNAHPDYVLRGILTTQGDLPYRGASDWTRLAIGSSNTHLISNGVVPSWVPIGGSVGGSGLVGLVHLAGPGTGFTYGTNQSLAAVSAGNGGAIALPIDVSAPMYLEGYVLFNGDTATARTAEARLYLDSGSATVAEITNSAATWSFTPSAASLRRVSLTSGAPVLLQPGSYWLVLRNTHATSTFNLRRVSVPTIVVTDWRVQAIAALGATLDLDTSWTNGSGNGALWLEGRVLGRTTVLS